MLVTERNSIGKVWKDEGPEHYLQLKVDGYRK